MAATLQLVTRHTEPSQEAATHRVFTDSLMGRLVTLNTAMRALRAMGYRAIKQEISPQGGGKPCVQIERNHAQSIAPLLDASFARNWHTKAGKKRGYVEFQGITVTWEEL